MRFDGSDGSSVSLWLTGYQFGDADDPRVRFSWHEVGGQVKDATGEWAFVDPALTCDKSQRLSSWLSAILDSDRGTAGSAQRSRLTFTKPNLTFDATSGEDGTITLQVGFDLESRPPWDRRTGAGDPYLVPMTIDAEQIRRAVQAWDEDLQRYPDGLAQ